MINTLTIIFRFCMMNESQRAMLRSKGTLLGRVLMGLLFFFSGVGILMQGTAGTVGFYESLGLPMAGLLVWVTLAIKLGAGGALILGYRVGAAALALIVFTIAATLVAHMNTEDPGLWKNLAVIGGLLYVMAYGTGESWKISR